MNLFLSLFLGASVLGAVSTLSAHGPGRENDFGGRRVLYIGIDGCRADAVLAAMERGLAPNLKALTQAPAGLWSHEVYAGGELGTPTHQRTVSGPGWTSLLTGVWLDQHGVRDNKFIGGRFQNCGHFMRHIKAHKPTAWCASFADWQPIHRFIADGSRQDGAEFLDVKFTRDAHAETYITHDMEIRAEAVKTLAEQNPDAMFVYFGQVDEYGHGAIDKRAAFDPRNDLYLTGIGVVDGHIGALLAAMRARPRFAEEDWMILITTDHGGVGNNHGGDSEVERRIWLAAHGTSLPREALLKGPTPQTAMVPLIYQHLKLPLPGHLRPAAE